MANSHKSTLRQYILETADKLTDRVNPINPIHFIPKIFHKLKQFMKKKLQIV